MRTPTSCRKISRGSTNLPTPRRDQERHGGLARCFGAMVGTKNRVWMGAAPVIACARGRASRVDHGPFLIGAHLRVGSGGATLSTVLDVFSPSSANCTAKLSATWRNILAVFNSPLVKPVPRLWLIP